MADSARPRLRPLGAPGAGFPQTSSVPGPPGTNHLLLICAGNYSYLAEDLQDHGREDAGSRYQKYWHRKYDGSVVGNVCFFMPSPSR